MDRCAALTRKTAELQLLVAFAGLACASKQPIPKAAEASPQPQYVIVINNTTDNSVAVYIAAETSHTRLGGVPPSAETALEVKPFHLRRGSRLRVYMFRGPEACPVARVVDFAVSRTPRVTVAASDTVLSAYLPADGCRAARK